MNAFFFVKKTWEYLLMLAYGQALMRNVVPRVRFMFD